LTQIEEVVIVIHDQTYLTIVDAAKRIGVSAKTVREYIAKGIIPEPPVVRYGIRLIKHFSQDYMEDAAKTLKQYHNSNSQKHILKR
jgi:predicted site-specific integrase-resolvase